MHVYSDKSEEGRQSILSRKVLMGRREYLFGGERLIWDGWILFRGKNDFSGMDGYFWERKDSSGMDGYFLGNRWTLLGAERHYYLRSR